VTFILVHTGKYRREDK